MKIFSGIYKIEDIETGAVYVGHADSDNGIKKRWSNHLSRLRNGKYEYSELQDAFNDNQDRIKWEILEQCSDDELVERENYWIKHCNLVDGWHVINKEKESKKISKVKDKSKMIEAQTGENNGHNTRLSKEDVLEIKHLLGLGVKQINIADKFGVSKTLISNINTEKRWASVKIDKEKAESIGVDTANLCTSANVQA